MRRPLLESPNALRERMANPAQVEATAPEAEMPPYLGSFCAHLRVLVGVPIEYLVPDARLLPTESIRFFYLDRSWTDRLIDGVMAAGKLGTREQGHHQSHNPTITARLDGLEAWVRSLQRGTSDYGTARDGATAQAGPVTGFIMRSEAVAGWPAMEVRAFDRVLGPYPDLTSKDVEAVRVPLLRLERLTPSIMIALFTGVPALVWCEEPHHGVQFGIKVFSGRPSILRRRPTGDPEQPPPTGHGAPIPVPFRAGGQRVLHIAGLRDRINSAAATDPDLTPQTGSAAFAVEVLDPPWRQRFQGTGGTPDVTGSRVFNAPVHVAELASEQATAERLNIALQGLQERQA
jgi:hypothetical protein